MLKIVFATDGSDEARAALSFLIRWPLAQGTQVRVVSVVPLYGGDVYWGWEILDQVKRGEWRWAEEAAEKARAALARDGLELSSSIREGDTTTQILQEAEAFEADLLVVGSRGLTGVDRFLLGSVASNVARHAHCPVLVAHAPKHDLRHAVLAVDGSEHAGKAVEFTSGLPLPAETEVVVTHVLRPYRPFHGMVPTEPQEVERLVQQARDRSASAAAEIIGAARERLRSAGKRATPNVLEGDPATEILKLAEQSEADLIVAGARGVSAIQRLVVGSVADRLLKSARCSLLLVH